MITRGVLVLPPARDEKQSKDIKAEPFLDALVWFQLACIRQKLEVV